MSELSSNLIEALRDGGAYVFDVVVEEHYRRGDLAFTKDGEIIFRPATVRLDRDDILDEDVQAQIAEFMRKNNVIKIHHNGETIWTKNPVQKRSLSLFWGDHLTSY